MPGIERQSDYYGFIPEVAQRTAAREAGAAFDLPSDEDIAGLLSGPSITAGMNDRRGRGTGFSPVHAGRAITASPSNTAPGFVFLLDDAGNTLALDSDPDANMRFSFDRVIDAKAFLQQNLGGTGWFYDDDTGEMTQARISDFSYSDGRQDRTDEVRRIL